MANVTGTSANEVLSGGNGDDVLNAVTNGGGGSDTLYGGDGNDRLMSDGGGDILYGGTGDIDIADLRLQSMTTGVNIDIAQQLLLTENDPTALYNVSGQVYLNSIERLFFYGGSGNDVVKGGIYADRLDGGSGADRLYGGAGNDELFGHAGNELLDGGADNDIFRIDGYVREIQGGSGVDKLYITGLNGYDAQGHVGIIEGVEQIWVKAGLSQISFSANQTPQVGLNGQIIGYNILVTDVSDGNGGYLGATIIASERADTVKGGLGNDHLIGNKGNDFLYGGGGDDILEGGIGGDRLYGGAGNDRLVVLSGPSQQPDVLIDGGDGIDTVNLNMQYVSGDLTVDFSNPSVLQVINGTSFVNIEKLEYDGAQGSDTVTGGDYADKINGRGGNDFIRGGGGDDLLWGGSGTDTAIYAGNFADYAVTAAGAKLTVTDSVIGRDGTDSLWEFEKLQFADGSYDVASKTFTV